MKQFFSNMMTKITKALSSKVMSLKKLSPKNLLKLLNPKTLLKLLGPKTLIIICLVATIIVMIYLGMGGGFGGGKGTGEGKGNSKIVNEDKMDVESNEPDAIAKEVSTEVPRTESIEESDEFAGVLETVTVVENDYVYENERISLDDFLIVITAIEGKIVVEIKDDNASLRAYETLLEALDEQNIDYVEK